MSPSLEPTVAESLNARLTPPTGRPMLSSTRLTFLGGNRLMNDVLDLREKVLGILDTCSRRSANMQANLPRIDRRKEVPPQKRQQAERKKGEDTERQ